MDVPWNIRPASRGDAALLGQLEARCFADPWSTASFRELLESPGSLALLASSGQETAGYIVARQITDTAEILNLAVLPEWRERGLGHRLLADMLDQLWSRGADEVYLEVRASNHAALRLYGAAGFIEVGHRRGYYDHPTEDALVLRTALADGGRER